MLTEPLPHKAMQRKPHLVPDTWSANGPGSEDLNPGNVSLHFSLRARNLAASLGSDFSSHFPPTSHCQVLLHLPLNIFRMPHPLSVGSSPPYPRLGSQHLLPGSPSQLPDCSAAAAVYNTDEQCVAPEQSPCHLGAGIWPFLVGWHTHRVCMPCFLLTFFCPDNSDLHSLPQSIPKYCLLFG